MVCVCARTCVHVCVCVCVCVLPLCVMGEVTDVVVILYPLYTVYEIAIFSDLRMTIVSKT